MARQGEHQISFIDNASGSGEEVRLGIDEMATCPPIEPNVDERWIQEVEEKFKRKFGDSPQQSKLSDDTKELRICKSLLDDEEFSKPKVVTIGPFHRHESRSIDKEKSFVMQFMTRLYHLDLASCAQKMKNQAADAFKCYFFPDIRPPCFDNTGFTEILLLDSFFILFMLTHTETFHRGMHDYSIESENWQFDPFKFFVIIMEKEEIMLDLLLLDNQIPFFVIKELYKELKLEKPLHKYALEFFETIHPRSTRGRKAQNSPPDFLHLLDLFHWSRVPKDKYVVEVKPWHNQLDSFYRPRYTPTAMELRESATMFKKKTFGSSLDITFRRGRIISVIGKLNIPTLHIHDYSNFIFHNLIAFEMQTQSRARCTMAFSAFMWNLLQTEKDVRLLRRCGILANTAMTDGELIDFFKCLSRLTENYQMPSDLYDVYNQVLSHHNRQMSQFCGSVILQYFRSPLVTLSVFAAIMLFVLTLLQTIYTVLGYYHHN